MKKNNISVFIRNSSEEKPYIYNLEGTIKDNIIKYKEPDGTAVTLYFSKDKVKLIRKNRQLEMELNFNENRKQKGVCLFKEIKKEIYLEIETYSLIYGQHKIEIKYHLIMDKESAGVFKYKLEYKE